MLRLEYPRADLAAREEDRRRGRRRRRRAGGLPDTPDAGILVDLSNNTPRARINARETPLQFVWLKENWTDPWVPQPLLHCTEAVWSAAPNQSTARINFPYGRIAQRGEIRFLTYLKLKAERFYLRVHFQLERNSAGVWQTRDWTGVVEVSEDRLGGVSFDDRAGVSPGQRAIATGQQQLTAMGLENLMFRTWVDAGYWQAGTGAAVQKVDRGLVFNAGGKPNKLPEDLGGGLHSFAAKRQDAEFWSSLDIVRYLLRYFSPKNKAGASILQFALSDEAAKVIPDWDEPELNPAGRTLHDLLTSLIPRQRLMSWYLDPANPTTVEAFSFSASPVSISLDGAGRIPPNARRVRLAFDEDPSSVATLATSAVHGVEQVVQRGARATSVCSLAWQDVTLDKGWTDEDKDAYNTAASSESDYPPPGDVVGQRARNIEYRSRPELADVFARFVIPDNWNLKAGDGQGGPVSEPVFPVFPAGSETPDAEPYQVYPMDLVVLPTIPLLIGIDYSGTTVGDGTHIGQEQRSTKPQRPPFVCFKVPQTTRYRDVATYGLLSGQEIESDEENNRWSASLAADDGDRAMRLRISGQFRHVIAKDDFVALGVDEPVGDNNWKDMVVTLALPDDRYCEGEYPSTASLAAKPDYLKRLVIQAGERYRLDYITPQTVVGIDGSGELLRSDGGFIHDDRDLLNQSARIAYEWYREKRTILTHESEKLTSQVLLGDLIVEIGSLRQDPKAGHYQKIQSAVTELRIITGEGAANAPPPPPRQRITTTAGELTPRRLRRPLEPDVEPGFRSFADQPEPFVSFADRTP